MMGPARRDAWERRADLGRSPARNAHSRRSQVRGCVGWAEVRQGAGRGGGAFGGKEGGSPARPALRKMMGSASDYTQVGPELPRNPLSRYWRECLISEYRTMTRSAGDADPESVSSLSSRNRSLRLSTVPSYISSFLFLPQISRAMWWPSSGWYCSSDVILSEAGARPLGDQVRRDSVTRCRRATSYCRYTSSGDPARSAVPSLAFGSSRWTYHEFSEIQDQQTLKPLALTPPSAVEFSFHNLMEFSSIGVADSIHHQNEVDEAVVLLAEDDTALRTLAAVFLRKDISASLRPAMAQKPCESPELIRSRTKQRNAATGT